MDIPGALSYRVSRLKFRATNLDIVLATVATFLLPLACGFLFDITGALLPLILYYGVFCYALIYWRKGSLDYVVPVKWSIRLFLFLFAIQIIGQVSGLLTLVPRNDPLVGVLVTFLIWVPLNAFSEQLLWVYIFDAFETRWTERWRRFAAGVIGVLMTFAFVGLIHALFWGRFLPSFENVAPWSTIFLLAQFVITFGYLLLYRRTGSMLPLFLIHIISDAALVLGAQYSILPDLWHF